MLLKLYKTDDANNVINKTLTDELIININLRSNVDVINPTILLETIQGVDLISFNYCTIPALNRNYYINDIVSVNNNLVSLECSCDYLETYKTEILNSICNYDVPINSGDYGSINIVGTGREIETLYYSNITLVESNNTVLSVMSEV